MKSLIVFLFLYFVKKIDATLSCVSSIIDHRCRQNVSRTSVTHLSNGSGAAFLF